MTAIEQIHNWSDFSWGEWDGFYYWPKWGYRLWKNINTKILENWVKVCTKFEDIGEIYSWDVLAINPYAYLSFATEDWNNWKIYKSWDLKITLSSWIAAQNKIMWFWKLTRTTDNINYVYAISQTSVWNWKVYRIATDYSSATEVGGFSLALWRTATFNYISILSLPWRIVFWCWNTIFELTNTEVLTELISFPQDAEIISISYYLDKYKIYYNVPKYTNWVNDWFVNYWDWISEFVDYFVKYEKSWIINVLNNWAYDYVVFGSTYSNDLYVMSWLNREQLRVNTEWTTNINSRNIYWIWDLREWIAYFYWMNKLWEECIYSYWNYYAGTSRSLVPENSITLNQMYASGDDLYARIDDWVSEWTGAIYKKSFLFSWSQESEWAIYSYPITWNYWGYTTKSIKEIDVTYKLWSSSRYIKIYVKISGSPTSNNTLWRTLIKTITWTDAEVRWVKVHSSELTAKWVWTFNQLEYKVELSESAFLYQIRTVYYDNIK